MQSHLPVALAPIRYFDRCHYSDRTSFGTSELMVILLHGVMGRYYSWRALGSFRYILGLLVTCSFVAITAIIRQLQDCAAVHFAHFSCHCGFVPGYHNIRFNFAILLDSPVRMMMI